MSAKEDFQSIRDGAKQISRCAEDFGTELQKLENTLGSDHPWGSDEAGTVFGMAYTAVLGHAVDTLGSHRDLLLVGSEKLSTWAENSKETEQENTRTGEQIETMLI